MASKWRVGRPFQMAMVASCSAVIAGCGGSRQAVQLPAPQRVVDAPVIEEDSVSLATAPHARPIMVEAEPLDMVTDPRFAEVELPVEIAEPFVAAAASAPSIDRVRVDAMVGQINGRPLFASEFFEPMDARLRAEAARRTPEDWMNYAREAIRLALVDRIRNELLLAEVESSLTPEQRAGLVTFVRSLREELVSEARGSEAIANRRLLEEEGVTLEEAVQARRNEELIRSWLRRILQNKVYVPWRDVRSRYERDYDVFNPPATASLRMIRVPASDADAIEAVTDGVSTGADLDALARAHSTYLAEQGGLFQRQIDTGDYATSSLIGLQELNVAAQRLAPGEVAGPIELGGNMYWIKLERIEQESRSLYEVQEEIQRQLFSERVVRAENEYYRDLLERSGLSQTEAERIGARLLEIAAERYLMSRQN